MREDHSQNHINRVKDNPPENDKKKKKQTVIFVDPGFNFFYSKHFNLLLVKESTIKVSMRSIYTKIIIQALYHNNITKFNWFLNVKCL